MDASNDSVAAWVSDLQFERLSPAKRAFKAALVNPLANYMPSGMMRAALKFGKSELAAANWKDPGGWRSMVISYTGKCNKLADQLLVSNGTMPMALRNRRKLGGRLIARLIESCDHDPVHVLCLGAGPGHIITDALTQCSREARATLVDLSSDAFDYGRQLAATNNLSHRVEFIQGDVRDVRKVLATPPDVVKMLGICEYLTDEQIVDIAQAVAAVTRPGTAIVFNSISQAHGTDRFFRRVFGLHMTYRSPRQLEALLSRAGFGEYVETAEPLGVYHVVIGRRLA